MPLYVYRCANGHTQEIRHGMNNTLHFVCPTCGKSLARVPQAVSFNIRIEDAGQRKAKEINAHLEERYRSNKDRREANEYEVNHGKDDVR